MARILPVSATRPADWKAIAAASDPAAWDALTGGTAAVTMATDLKNDLARTTHLMNDGVYNSQAKGMWRVDTPSGKRQIVGQRLSSMPVAMYHYLRDKMPEMFDGSKKAQRLRDQWLATHGAAWATNRIR